VAFPETGAPKPDRSGVVSRNAVFLPLTVLHRRKMSVNAGLGRKWSSADRIRGDGEDDSASDEAHL
jgi:hypothetical protein